MASLGLSRPALVEAVCSLHGQLLYNEPASESQTIPLGEREYGDDIPLTLTNEPESAKVHRGD